MKVNKKNPNRGHVGRRTYSTLNNIYRTLHVNSIKVCLKKVSLNL